MDVRSDSAGRQLPRDADLKHSPAHDDFSFDPIAEHVKGSAHSQSKSFHDKSAVPDEDMATDTDSRAAAHNRSASGGLADFFSTEVFQIVLHNPTTAHRLLKFSQSRFCGENMEFLEMVDRYNVLVDELTRTMTEMHRLYTAPDAVKPINISQTVTKKINSDVKVCTVSILPSMEAIFAGAQEHVEQLLATDIYPRFVRYQLTTSARKAFSADRGKYQGLGDCFCLTDPAKADNPIVYASDGFIGVTGYSRADIIPRNCRFLQGNYTDHAATKRIRAAVESREESVELLLNYRKNGEPFWNLLYVAPLLDAQGKVAFFLGGQINCSTTVHNCADILRILSVSDNPEDDVAPVTKPASLKKGSNGGRKLLRSIMSSKSSKPAETREAGMEQGLLKKIENMSLGAQMKVFYAAYSKYIVLCDEFRVRFFSAGVFDELASSAPIDVNIVDRDIFKVLKERSPSLPWDLRAQIKDSLRQGRPFASDVYLSTRWSIGRTKSGEKFVTNWTPVKDEHSVTHYIILTMNSATQS